MYFVIKLADYTFHTRRVRNKSRVRSKTMENNNISVEEWRLDTEQSNPVRGIAVRITTVIIYQEIEQSLSDSDYNFGATFFLVRLLLCARRHLAQSKLFHIDASFSPVVTSLRFSIIFNLTISLLRTRQSIERAIRAIMCELYFAKMTKYTSEVLFKVLRHFCMRIVNA